MAIKTFATGEVLTASDTNTYLANSGLVYVTNFTGTNTAVVNVDNCFTSTYDNYLLVIQSMTSHGNGFIPQIQFRYAGPTTQTTTYYSGIVGATYTGTNTNRNVNNGTVGYIGNGCDNLGNGNGIVNIARTSAQIAYTCQFSDYYNAVWSQGGGYVTTSRTYTGFALSMSSGNISVTATLYGYRKA